MKEYRELEREINESATLTWDELPPNVDAKLRAAFKKLESLATRPSDDDDDVNGNVEAVFCLAVLLMNGRGCEKDEYRAVDYLKFAHRCGHVEGAFLLGEMYFYDRGLDIIQPYFNQFRGVVLWQWCADRGFAPAHLKLAQAYRLGIGVKRPNEKKAAEHFSKATNQSVADAWSHIAEMYENGTGGVAKDESRAAAKYAESASHGNAKAMYNLGNMYLDGEAGQHVPGR